MTSPPLGPERPAMDLTCGRMIGDGHCNKPGVWHYFWDADGKNGVTCQEHADEAVERGWGHDRHPIGQVCTMPGTVWFHSETHPPGYCQWVVDDETLAMDEARPDELVLSTSGSGKGASHE